MNAAKYLTGIEMRLGLLTPADQKARLANRRRLESPCYRYGRRVPRRRAASILRDCSLGLRMAAMTRQIKASAMIVPPST